MEVDVPALPERVEFVPHPALTAGQMRVAMGAFDSSDVSDTELAESDVELDLHELDLNRDGGS